MDINKLSESDKYLLYGLLLRKKRPEEAELRVLEIIRGPLDLDRKIDAILSLHRKLPGYRADEEEELLRPTAAPAPSARQGRRLRAVVADPRPEVTRLLAKSSLRTTLEFHQAQNVKQALSLVGRLRARLLVCNLGLAAAEQNAFFQACRSRQPRLRAVFLCDRPADCLPPDLQTAAVLRVLAKPINLIELTEAVRELLEAP